MKRYRCLPGRINEEIRRLSRKNKEEIGIYKWKRVES